jgi:hypothetical protein
MIRKVIFIGLLFTLSNGKYEKALVSYAPFHHTRSFIYFGNLNWENKYPVTRANVEYIVCPEDYPYICIPSPEMESAGFCYNEQQTENNEGKIIDCTKLENYQLWPEAEMDIFVAMSVEFDSYKSLRSKLYPKVMANPKLTICIAGCRHQIDGLITIAFMVGKENIKINVKNFIANSWTYESIY